MYYCIIVYIVWVTSHMTQYNFMVDIICIVFVYYVELYWYHGQFIVLSRREPVSCVYE